MIANTTKTLKVNSSLHSAVKKHKNKTGIQMQRLTEDIMIAGMKQLNIFFEPSVTRYEHKDL